MRRRTMRALPLVAALAMSFGLVGCDLLDPDEGARVNVYLTDAPGDVDKAWIKIDGISLIGDESGDVALDGEFADLILVSDLVNRARQIVRDEEVELDSFKQLRLVLGGAVIQTKTGAVFATPGQALPAGVSSSNVGELQCPSCSTSGLKIVLRGQSPEVEEGDDMTITVDFDVAQSFGRQSGASGRWTMRPVVFATRVAVPSQPLSGNSISGSVALGSGVTIPQCPAGTARSLADFVPSATAATLKDANNAAVVRSGTTTATGAFTIANVDADSYTLGTLPVTVGTGTTFNLRFTATANPATVQVQQGQNVSNVAYTVTAVSCTAS
jgi:hypothetical protein